MRRPGERLEAALERLLERYDDLALLDRIAALERILGYERVTRDMKRDRQADEAFARDILSHPPLL